MNLLGLKFRFWLRAQWFKHLKKARYRPFPAIFFIHIPKTAGTSFRNMLFRVVDQRVSYPNLTDLSQRNGNYPNFQDFQMERQSNNREIRFLTGHYPFAAGDLIDGPKHYYVFLREPVARTISNLLHFQRNEPASHELSLRDIFQKHRPHLQNLQTRFLCDTTINDLHTFNNPRLLSEKHLEQAKAHLEKCTFVGITERFPESIKIAEKLLQTKLGSRLKRNVSPESPSTLDPLLREYIKPFLELDIQLYQHALHLFELQQSRILKE